MIDDLEPLRLAAEELGLTTSEPVFYEVVVPAHKNVCWGFTIVAVSLDGTRETVWAESYWSRWWGKRRAARHAKRLAHENSVDPFRAWVGG